MKYLQILALLVLVYTVSSRPSEKEDEDYLSTLPSEGEDVQNDDDYDGEDGEEDDSQDPNTGTPEILSKPTHLLKNPGDTVYLPCETQFAINYVTSWYKDNTQNPIYHGNIGLKGSHYSINKDESNRTLVIKDATPDDTGEYICIIRVGDKEKLEVVHKLKVKTPPTIVSLSAQKNLTTIEAGKTLVLKCMADGIPAPKITWSRGGSRIHGHGDSITIEEISHDRAGVYQCMADNEIGKPAHSSITIKVTHKPTIKLEKLTVNSAEGYESELTCIVHAEPKAIVVWKKDGVKIQSSKSLLYSHEGNKFRLTILKTKKEDFGNYTCSASNHLGRAEQIITLSGMPSPAEFVAEEPMHGKNPVLTWTVESNSPISEYILEYRKSGTHEWIAEKPEVTNPDGNLYTVKHTLIDLDPVKYETRLKSKNNYGWSPYSKIHHFNGDIHHQHHENIEREQAEDPSAASISGAEVSTHLPVLFILAHLVTILNRCI